ncbi:MAG: hypothetical protein ACK4M9_01765 [Anaerobacillus sp.]|uniref:hypothetical protein n=1 Tax=Anaerobacillus sp. TaxID=1872506 RepID=UPI003919AC59
MENKRSRLIWVSCIWTLVYGYLIGQADDLEGGMAIFLVLAVWPLFFIAQVILYAMFKDYNNHKWYVFLFLIKSFLFLIQPLLMEYIRSHAIFVLSVIAVFFIDFHIMKLKNKIDLKNVKLTDFEMNEVSQQFKQSWTLMGSVVILFASYIQFTENNFSAILAFSLLYYFFVLGKQKEKGKLASIQILGVILVWSLTLLNWSEFIRDPLLIILLTLIYFFKKRIIKTNEFKPKY